MVCTSHRRQLNPTHLYRQNKCWFDDKLEIKGTTHVYHQNKCWFDDKLEIKGTAQPIFPKQTL